jgi:hypothetical protein
MAGPFRIAFAASSIAVALAAWPAMAQFGTIFGDPPPRPPSNVPGRSPGPSIFQPEPIAPPPQPSQPAARPQQAPGQPGAARPPQGGVQSQPLPAPPGAIAVEPPPEDSPQGRGPGTQPGLRPTQPAGTAPQQGDEVVVATPSQKIANPTAVFSGLDKVTGRIIKFDVEINETVQFGALQVTPRACNTRPPTESPNTTSFIEVDEVTLQGEVRRIFTGWMFANSPGLHAVEHPIYDVWLTDCKGAKSAVAETQPSPPPAQPAAAAAPQRQRSPQRPPPPRQQPGPAPIR